MFCHQKIGKQVNNYLSNLKVHFIFWHNNHDMFLIFCQMDRLIMNHIKNKPVVMLADKWKKVITVREFFSSMINSVDKFVEASSKCQ